ncbi:MAG TPA: hypothetical protein VK885_14105 [Desulfotignum sp.]|nr:hypothetical protein [Desulfotignum sp.]
MEQHPTSIRGIIVPASWDAGGSPLGTAIVTFDEDIFTVTDSESGRALVRHLRETVTVTGWTETLGSAKIIHVENFHIHGPGEAA